MKGVNEDGEMDTLHELDNWNNTRRENEEAMRMLSPRQAVTYLQPKDLRGTGRE